MGDFGWLFLTIGFYRPNAKLKLHTAADISRNDKAFYVSNFCIELNDDQRHFCYMLLFNSYNYCKNYSWNYRGYC